MQKTAWFIGAYIMLPAVVVVLIPLLTGWKDVTPADYVAMYFLGLFAIGFRAALPWLFSVRDKNSN